MRRRQPVLVDRFHQIVDRMGVERPQRMVAVSGDEHEQRRLDVHHPVDHRKAVEARHLDVEKHQVRLLGLDLANSLAPVRRCRRPRYREAPEAAIAGPGSPMFRRRRGWCGWSFDWCCVPRAKGFHDHAEPAMFPSGAIEHFEPLILAIGLVQPIANIGEPDPGRLAGRDSAAFAVAIVGHLDPDPGPTRLALIQMSAPFSRGVTAYLIAFSISGWSSSEGRRAPIVPGSIRKSGRIRSSNRIFSMSR